MNSYTSNHFSMNLLVVNAINQNNRLLQSQEVKSFVIRSLKKVLNNFRYERGVDEHVKDLKEAATIIDSEQSAIVYDESLLKEVLEKGVEILLRYGQGSEVGTLFDWLKDSLSGILNLFCKKKNIELPQLSLEAYIYRWKCQRKFVCRSSRGGWWYHCYQEDSLVENLLFSESAINQFEVDNNQLLLRLGYDNNCRHDYRFSEDDPLYSELHLTLFKTYILFEMNRAGDGLFSLQLPDYSSCLEYIDV